MFLSDLSVKRPVFATVISALMLSLGIFSLFQMPLRETPDIDPPVVSIRTEYTGASAAIVESKVTQIIEDEISGIEGIETIESGSRDGRSDITITFKIERDIDAASNDVRDRVARVVDRLPDEAESPEVAKADGDTEPIMWINVISDSLNELELTDYIDRFLVDRLSAVNGVSRIRVGGEKRYAMRIWLDRKKMALRDITVNDIEDILTRENIELPAGRIETSARDLSVRTLRKYSTPEDFRSLVLRRGMDGALVRLGDVAEVVLGAAETRSEFRASGKPGLALGIIKQSKANTLEVARGIKAEVARVRPSFPDGLDIFVSTDYSIFIEAALTEVNRTLAITALLVVVVIFLFVGDVKATLVPAVTVPISLVSSFIALALFGFSINILTLLAMVLAIGLVVDDAIVVLENIYRRVRKGEPPLLAAYRGAQQVGFAVIATTIVLIAVLMPISLIPGDVGRLFSEFALTLAATVFFSSIVALTLCPVLCTLLLSQESGPNRLGRFADQRLDKLRDAYSRVLKWFLDQPLVAVFLTIAALCTIFVLMQRLPGEFVPPEDRGSFFIIADAPVGTSFAYSQDRQREAEAEMESLIGDGKPGDRFLSFVPRFGSSTGGFNIINLKDWSDRDESVHDLARAAYVSMQKYPGATFLAFPRRGLGGGRARQNLEIVIGGGTFEQLRPLRDKMLKALADNPNIYGQDADYKETTPQLTVDIDRNRAADLGVSIQAIGRTLETMLGSRKITTFIQDGEEYDVILQAGVSDRRTPSDLNNMYVRSTTSNTLIPLSNLVSLNEIGTADTLNRFNRLRAITISASTRPGYPLGDAVGYVKDVASEILPEGTTLDFKGEARDLANSNAALALAFGLSLLVVFLVLSAQFESFKHPFVIMIAVPFAIASALLGLAASGQTLNIYSQIGIIVLVGLAAKNSILIVEFINQLREKGVPADEAIIVASRERLRPILMTSLSTSLGAVPLMIASGAGSEARVAIGVVIFYGVFVSMIFTLFVVPVFYQLFGRNTRAPNAVAVEVNGLDARYPRLVTKPQDPASTHAE
ncbi:MAG: efflux RND transporter permease subunit [Pseudomonadota bacterium]